MTFALTPLDQQVIVVTGASSGIGLLTAKAAATRGAKVLLVARNEAALQEAVAGIAAAGGTAACSVADVGDAEALRRAARHAVQRFGRIDTWVNDAGVAIYARLLDTPEDEHEQLFRTNYFGAVHGCRAALPELIAHGGALITVASIAADLPSPLMGAYAASKHAVRAYVETLRIELAEIDAPVSVTLINPAGIDTPIAEHAAVHVEGAARIPPPVYDPQLVADAILHAAVHPTRELTVGGAGRAQVLFAQHFPTLFEKLAPAAAKTFVDPKGHQPGPDNLFATARAGRGRSQDQPGRRVSLYTAAAEHPKTTLAVGAGVLAAAATLLFAERRAARAVGVSTCTNAKRAGWAKAATEIAAYERQLAKHYGRPH